MVSMFLIAVVASVFGAFALVGVLAALVGLYAWVTRA